ILADEAGQMRLASHGRVSILVLMDHPRGHENRHRASRGTWVSILVLMDHPRGPLSVWVPWFAPSRVSILVLMDHPRGQHSENERRTSPNVSILVLMDHPRGLVGLQHLRV